MTRTLRPLRLVLALASVVLSTVVLSGLAGGPTLTTAGADGTALPAGWELCVLQGTNAPLTPDNVADLDGWQVEEGGSTNNTAAYNPFNTARTTDVTGAPLPTVPSSGFPAFANWVAGCSATAATLLQPNMSTITAALRAGNVAPSAAFLALVDQSQWCAPSADGVPCYANAILGSATSLAGGVLNGSAALDVYGSVKSDLQKYQIATLAVAADKTDVAAKSQQMATAESEASSTRAKFDASQQALRSFAVNEYVSSGLYVSNSYANPSAGHKRYGQFGPPTPNGVLAQQYESVETSDVLARTAEAASALKASLTRRADAAKALQQSVATLTSDTGTETRALVRLVADVATLQTAGACTTATVTAAALNAGAPDTTTTTAPAGTTTTTPTTSGQSVPATTVPTTSTTTTSTSTTTTLPIIKVPVTTTTVPATTTTTSSSTSTTATTTTTTTPGTAPANTPAPTPNPAGIQALQGCVAALAPAGQ